MTDTDLVREAIERSFTGEPAPRPVDERIRDGRSALRRRRTVGTAVGCAVVAVLGATYALGASDSDRDADHIIATEPPSPSASGPAWEDNTPIRYVGGRLEIREGAIVHQRIRNPYGYPSPRQSDALDLTYEGQRMWIIAEQGANGFGYSSSVPSAGWATFRAWVDDQVTQSGADGYPRMMRLTPDGRVVPTAGTEVFQRTDDPRLGDGFAPPGTTTGAAVVQPDGGTSYFVVWRVVDGSLDVITLPPRDTVGATFDELLASARSKYASGEGLR